VLEQGSRADDDQLDIRNFPLYERKSSEEPVKSLSWIEPAEKEDSRSYILEFFERLDRRIESDILPWCLANKTGVIAYSPIQNGLLSGKFDKSRLAPDDWRLKNSFFKEPEFSKNLDFAHKLKPIAERYNKTVLQLAIAWVLMHPAVTAAIVGARRGSQIDEIVGGADWKLSEADMAEIEALREDILK